MRREAAGGREFFIYLLVYSNRLCSYQTYLARLEEYKAAFICYIPLHPPLFPQECYKSHPFKTTTTTTTTTTTKNANFESASKTSQTRKMVLHNIDKFNLRT